MLLDHVVLVGGQRPGLAQDAVWDGDLAHVVEQAGELDGATLLGLETDQVGQEQGVAGDVLGVPLGVAILGVDGEDQPGQHVEARALGGRQLLRRQVGHPHGVAAAGLGLGQGPGGHRQQLGRGLAVGRRIAHAGADGDGQPLESRAEEVGQRRSITSRARRSMAGSRSNT